MVPRRTGLVTLEETASALGLARKVVYCTFHHLALLVRALWCPLSNGSGHASARGVSEEEYQKIGIFKMKPKIWFRSLTTGNLVEYSIPKIYLMHTILKTHGQNLINLMIHVSMLPKLVIEKLSRIMNFMLIPAAT